MTRIVGFLEGVNGALNRRLYVKAGGAFIGAPSKDLSFKVEDGLVDIELPPCPAGMPYFVDWKDAGDITRLTYMERWRVPSISEITIDDARGVSRQGTLRQNVARKGDALENIALRNELSEEQEKVRLLEEQNTKLLRQLTEAESNAAAAKGQAAALAANLSQAQKKAHKPSEPVVIKTEHVIEKRIGPDSLIQEIASYQEEIELLKQANTELKDEINRAMSVSTHFANLHAEIDRLSNEKRQLLLRIDQLKSPVRQSSALRNEAIANLDKLING
jgi:hypothetical protein